LIRLRVLGPIELQDAAGREVRSVIAQPKRLALLACLVVGPRGFRRRDSLLALLWPELDQARARGALNQAVRFLRKELDGSTSSVIVNRGAEEIGIDPASVWCDAMAFRDHMEAGRYSEALELYRGDLLEAFFAEQGAGFQDWLSRERELLRASAARAARELAAMQERDRQYTPAVAAARRAVQLSEADERLVRELLLLLDRLGDRAGAVQAYEDFAQRLALEFDVKPAAETQALIERIRARATPAERLVSRRPGDGNGAARAGSADSVVEIPSGGPAPGQDSSPGSMSHGGPDAYARRDVIRRWARRGALLLTGALVGSLLTWLLLS
jgi:serine/threonine-protein kinase